MDALELRFLLTGLLAITPSVCVTRILSFSSVAIISGFGVASSNGLLAICREACSSVTSDSLSILSPSHVEMVVIYFPGFGIGCSAPSVRISKGVSSKPFASRISSFCGSILLKCVGSELSVSIEASMSCFAGELQDVRMEFHTNR